jgi:hypothetical protein
MSCVSRKGDEDDQKKDSLEQRPPEAGPIVQTMGIDYSSDALMPYDVSAP